MPGKKALLIGLNYSLDTSCALMGCINDIKMMSAFLTQTTGFNKNDITMITDENLSNLYPASNQGIIDALYDLCIKSWSENLEYVYFHYSGHGSQQADTSSDEVDGMDEGIVPTDFRKNGLILDDKLKQIFSRFNPRTKVVCVFDCCHSGSIVDLRYCYDKSKEVASGQKPTMSNTELSKVFCISGCRDSQTSADAVDEDLHIPAGALTSGIIKCLKTSNGVLSLFNLQSQLALHLAKRGYSQYPLLSSSVPITNDVYTF